MSNENNCPEYQTFEDKIEKLFKKNKINIVSSSYNLEKQILHDFDDAIKETSITPQDDFYSYINEKWLKNINLESSQKYIVEIDDFRIVQDKVYRELIQIIENYLDDHTITNTKKKLCIRKAFNSFKSFNTPKQTFQTSTKIKEFIDNLIDKSLQDKIDTKINVNKYLWELLAFFNKNEIISCGCPFIWTINPDDKNPKIYKCYIELPELTLLDEKIYMDYKDDSLEDKKYKIKYRKEYFKYLYNLFKCAFGENAKSFNINIENVYLCEIELLKVMMINNIKEDEYGYNLIKKETWTKYKFDWEQFCKCLGFKDNEIPDCFVVSNLNYFKYCTELLIQKWNTPQWRDYWIYLYIRQQCRWSKYGSVNFFEFIGKFLRGQEKYMDLYIRPVFGMSFTFNTFLTNEYIKKYKNDKVINYVKNLAEDLKIVFSRIIKRNNWMLPATKKIALNKLDKLNIVVGSPKILREDPLLDYKENDTWGNLVKIAEWRNKKAIELVNKTVIDIPVIDWMRIPPKLVGTQAYVVNAMYTPTENSIYIPLGYLQKPFVDLDQNIIEYNLAHIGFTIAHEMSHALDDWGSLYDANGILRNWWTIKEKKEFKKIQDDVIKQYETFAKYDNIKFDASLSIGEDLADISGLYICLEYLRDYQLKNQLILPLQSLSFEQFFIHYAIQSKQKISKEAIIAQLKTNPHPLDKYRCNVPLSRLRIFRSIYNVKKGDKMWWKDFNSVWKD